MFRHIYTLAIITAFFYFINIPSALSLDYSHKFREISMTDGLSDLTVRSIYKDSTGFVWIGTDSSLDKFDGINIVSYKTENLKKNTPVYTITSGPANNIWFGTGSGLYFLDGNSGTVKQYAENIIDATVYDLLYINDILYAATSKGLFEDNGKEIIQKLPENNILSKSNKIKGISFGAGRLWLATENGLYSYSPGSEEITNHEIPEEISFNCVSFIEGKVYLGTSGFGIYEYDTSVSTFQKTPFLENSIITSLSADIDNDLLLISTDGKGIHYYSLNQRKVQHSFVHDVTGKNGSSIRSNSVYSFLSDREGIIWIGYYQGGLDYSLYQKPFFEIFSHESGFDSEGLTVRTFSVHDSFKLIGAREGLYLIDEKKNEALTYNKGELSSNLILSSVWYNGLFYIGTYGGGLWTLDPYKKILKRFNPCGNTLDKVHIFCLNTDPNDNLWIGTSAGVFVKNKENHEVVHFNSGNSQLIEGNVYEIFFDSSGKGWICTEHGVSLYDVTSGSVRSNIFPEGFINKEKVRYIFEDSNNRLYFLPEKGDIFVSDINMTLFSYLNFGNIVYGNSFMSMIEDRKGNLWLTADAGLLCYEPQNGQIYPFGFQDGLPSQLFTNRAAYSDNNGTIWFGNSKGLVSFNPENIDFADRYPYNLQITSISVNGEPINRDSDKDSEKIMKAITFGNKNNLSLSFSPLTYSSLNSMLFEYKLEGYEKEWNHKMGISDITYHNLPAGKYRFLVKISGIENSVTYKDIRISFSVYVWIGLVTILLVIALFILFIVRNYTVSRKEPEVNENVNTTVPENPEKADQEKYKTTKHSEEDCEKLAVSLRELMKCSDIYKDPDLKIADLAKALNTSSHSLSYLFNQYLNITYSDFINEYRVNMFKEMIAESDVNKYTLSALAEHCGFSSRASFFRYFKKSTGMTPKEYMQQMENNPEK